MMNLKRVPSLKIESSILVLKAGFSDSQKRDPDTGMWSGGGGTTKKPKSTERYTEEITGSGGRNLGHIEGDSFWNKRELKEELEYLFPSEEFEDGDVDAVWDSLPNHFRGDVEEERTRGLDRIWGAEGNTGNETIGRWLERHDVREVDRKYVFYHATPKVGGATNKLSKDSLLEFTQEDARSIVVGHHGIEGDEDIVVHELHLSPDQVDGGNWARLREDVYLKEASKSLTLTNLKLKAGFSDSQKRDSDTGMWSNGGGTATESKKPKSTEQKLMSLGRQDFPEDLSYEDFQNRYIIHGTEVSAEEDLTVLNPEIGSTVTEAYGEYDELLKDELVFFANTEDVGTALQFSGSGWSPSGEPHILLVDMAESSANFVRAGGSSEGGGWTLGIDDNTGRMVESDQLYDMPLQVESNDIYTYDSVDVDYAIRVKDLKEYYGVKQNAQIDGKMLYDFLRSSKQESLYGEGHRKDPDQARLFEKSIKLKAGYKEDQSRSSDTGQWTGTGGTAKKPKTTKPTESKKFKEWFLDSQVVDENGEPLVVYHGSKHDIDEFKAGYEDGLLFFSKDPDFATRWATRSRPEDAVGEDVREYQREVFRDGLEQQGHPRDVNIMEIPDEDFTLAKQYQSDQMEQRYGFPNTSEMERKKDLKLYPVYLSVQKLFDPRVDYKKIEGFLKSKDSGKDAEWLDREGKHKAGNWIIYERPDVVKELGRMGYDGMILAESMLGGVDRPHDTIAVWDSSKIKSTLNQGEWNPDDPRILKSLTLTNFRIKAGYKEDQVRSSETGQWTGGGGTSTKPSKPKKPTLSKEERDKNLREWHSGHEALMDEDTELPRVVYHGTTHNFNDFEMSALHTVEGDWGKGMYFSSNPADVGQNYTSVDDPDLSIKIDVLSEKLEEEFAGLPNSLGEPDELRAKQRNELVDSFLDKYGETLSPQSLEIMESIRSGTHPIIKQLDMVGIPSGASELPFRVHQQYRERLKLSRTLSKELVTDALSGGGGRMMPMYLSMDNPLVVGQFDPYHMADGGSKETIFKTSEMYDPDLDEYVQVDGGYPKNSIVKVVEAINQVAYDNYDIANPAKEMNMTGFWDVMESRDDGSGEYTASGIVQAVRNSALHIESQNDSRLESGNFAREVFREMGFDGVVDQEVHKKFSSMLGVNPDTVHYVIWDKGKAKSSSGNSGEFSKEDTRFGKSLSLIQFTVKAGYKPEQRRDPNTGMWTGGGGTATKPKKPKKETRRTLEEEIHARGGKMDDNFDYTGEDAVDDDVARNLREWENPDLLHEYKVSTQQKYNDNIYDRQRDYMLGLHGFQISTLQSYTGDAYGAYSGAISDPRFWEWQGSGGDAVYDDLNSEYLRSSFTGAQRLRFMIEKSPDISEDTILYSGTGAEHYLLGNPLVSEQYPKYGKMLEEEYQKIEVDFEESMYRLKELKWEEPYHEEVKRASNLLGHRVAAEISKNMKYKGELSPKRFLSTSTDLKQATHFSELGNVEHDSLWTTSGYERGKGLVPIVIARYKGLKKGLGVAPLTATSRHVGEMEVLIGGGTNKMKFVGASYDDELYGKEDIGAGKAHRGIIYVDFEGVE